MSRVIDFHVHAFAGKFMSEGFLGRIRKQARGWWKPISGSMHTAQTYLRHLPEPARKPLDELTGVAPLLGLAFESTVPDLLHAMDESGVDQALVIAHPPFISNELVMEAFRKNPRLLPVVNIPKDSPRPSTRLKHYVKHGARALKIHTSADGEALESSRYHSLLKTAADLDLPVILHTGCLHSRLLYKAPTLARAEIFTPWFTQYPDVKFVLAHMNFHEPQIAFDLAEEHLNVYLDTSWQPAEVIGESVRRLGAERILFATDWPFVGSNLSVGLSRVRECVDAGALTEAQSKMILGENAARLLKLSTPEPQVTPDAS